MPIAQALADFKAAVSQCDNLIANAHKADSAGAPYFSALDREQITVAAFLNMFIAWEAFLEETIARFMAGATTIRGAPPVKYVSPQSDIHARTMIRGSMTYFDYANHEKVRTMAKIYFENGFPFDPHLSAIFSELVDLKTIRNACAHLSSTTRTPLESLALRIFGAPKTGISVYQMLTALNPRSPAGETVFLTYKNKLMVTAELIAMG